MKPNSPMDRAHDLMMLLLDGQLKEAEKKELNRLLDRDPELHDEFQTLTRLKEVTDTMALKSPDKDVWNTYWYNVYNRIERGLAWFLFTLGAAVVIAYGFIHALCDLWKSRDLPWMIKLGICGAILGIVLLILSVIREKLFLRRHERYKEVQR